MDDVLQQNINDWTETSEIVALGHHNHAPQNRTDGVRRFFSS